MTLTELIATLGPIGGVALFMWLNRGPSKADKPDPIAQKLDVLIAKADHGNSALSQIATDIAILKDRSDR